MSRSLSTLAVVAAFAAAVTAPAAAGPRIAIVGGTPAQRRLAELVAYRVGGVTLREVRFRARGSTMLVTSSQPRTVRGEWELHLYAGTFLALNARYRVPLGGIVAGGSAGPASQWRPFDLYSRLPTSLQIGVLDMRLSEAAARAGAKVLELRTAATPARAIAVTLQVSDPAAFLKHRALSLLNVLDRTKVPLLGYYVGLEDADAKLVWATSRLPNEGAVYATSALDACSPVTHSEAVGAKELPCPAK